MGGQACIIALGFLWFKFIDISMYDKRQTYTKKAVMRTNIIINGELMNETLKSTDLKTKKAVVEEGLRK